MFRWLPFLLAAILLSMPRAGDAARVKKLQSGKPARLPRKPAPPQPDPPPSRPQPLPPVTKVSDKIVALEAALGPAQTLEEGIRLYQDAQFAESILVLDKFLRSEQEVEVKKQAKLYMGMNFLAIGNEVRARAVFQDLLDLDPDFLLPTFTSPSVRTFFGDVKAKYKIIPAVEHEPPAEIDALKGVDLNITVRRMRPGYQARLMYRHHGVPFFSRVDLSEVEKNQYVAKIPPAMLVATDGYTLEYFLVVTEGPDTVLTQLRSPDSPFSVPVSIPVKYQAAPVYKRWWFWTALGGAVAAAAGGTVLGLVLTRNAAPPPTGHARVELRF